MGGNASSQWYTGSCGGTLIGTGASITVTPSTTTTYYVGNMSCGTLTSCASTTVTVNPAPYHTNNFCKWSNKHFVREEALHLHHRAQVEIRGVQEQLHNPLRLVLLEPIL